MSDMATLDALKTMVRSQTAALLAALDALADDAPVTPVPTPIPVRSAWDNQLTVRGVRYTPGSVYTLAASHYLEDNAQGMHHILIDVQDAQGRRIVGAPVRFFWADGEDRRITEAKPGEMWALAWPLYAAGNGYGFALDDGTCITGMGLGTIAHPELGAHVAYAFVFRPAPDTRG